MVQNDLFRGILWRTREVPEVERWCARGQASDGVIFGVKTEATNVETNVTFPGETNEEGLYNIPNLPPGMYRVIVRTFAFTTVVKPEVELHVQDVIALNFSMEISTNP